MDYDGMLESLNIKDSSASIPEPVSIRNNRDKKNTNISKDDKTDPLKESPVESKNIQSPVMIKPEQKDPDNTLSIVLEKRADAPSKDIKAANVSCP